ncbi:MAG: acyltransferase [Fibrobacterota bacterium]
MLKLYNAFLSFKTNLFTMLIKHDFYKFGKESRINPPATVSNAAKISIGNHVIIKKHAWLNVLDNNDPQRPSLIIGDNTYIGNSVQINAWNNVILEDHVLVADRVYISDADHNFTQTDKPIRTQGDSFKGKVHLKSGCWIGIGAVILPGITIGKNAIVAANALVTKDVPDNAVVGGNPAKIIKVINEEEQ